MTRPLGRVPLQRIGAWLAIFGLLLQVGLSAAHSAHHFDHVVGNVLSIAPLGSTELSSDAGSPSPTAPASRGLDHCAVGLGLAASGSFVLPAAAVVPLPPVRDAARLEGEPQASAAAYRRHRLPPARAPPIVVISL